MSKHRFLGLIAVGAILGILDFAPSFAGLVQVGDLVTLNYASDYSGDGSGGAFAVSKTGGGFLFNTFCLERNEYFSPGGSYTVSDISLDAINGGIGGPHPDPISIQTQFLYSRYINGLTSGDGHTQANLQNAIWYFEQEITAYDAGAQFYVDMANNYVAGGGQAINSIKVLNLTDAGGTQAQSQLVYVPEPGTLLLLGSGLLGLVVARRKMFRK